MKLIISFLIILSLNSNANAQSKTIGTENRKELLVSMPFLSDKNAKIIDEGLKQLKGIISIQACYELNVMIIVFNSEIQNEENILNNMKSQEINSTVEQLHSSDVQNIKSKYEISTIR